MSEWIALRPDEKKLSELQTSQGLHVRVLVSPYDVPDAVRGYSDHDLGRFVIEFKYVGEEDWKLVPHAPDLSLRVGVNSDRLYGMEIDVRALEATTVSLQIAAKNQVKEAFKALAGRARRPSSASNYELARSFIDDKSDRLFADLSQVPGQA